MNDGCLGCFVLIGVIIAILLLDFFLAAGLVWLICWGFGWTFSWKIAIGVYAAICLIQMALGCLVKRSE